MSEGWDLKQVLKWTPCRNRKPRRSSRDRIRFLVKKTTIVRYGKSIFEESVFPNYYKQIKKQSNTTTAPE